MISYFVKRKKTFMYWENMRICVEMFERFEQTLISISSDNKNSSTVWRDMIAPPEFNKILMFAKKIKEVFLDEEETDINLNVIEAKQIYDNELITLGDTFEMLII